MKKYILIIALVILGCDIISSPPTPGDETEPLGLLWKYEYDYFGWGPRAAPAPVGDSLVIMTGDVYITCLGADSGSVKWKYPVPGGREAKMWNLPIDDTQFFGWQKEEREVLFALDLATGHENWFIDSCAYSDLHGLGPAYYSPHGREAFKVSLEGEVLDTISSD